MQYAVYFKWNDGFEDSFIAEDAKDRNMNIKEMIARNDFCEIHYCPIYASGEYGMNTQVIGSRF